MTFNPFWVKAKPYTPKNALAGTALKVSGQSVSVDLLPVPRTSEQGRSLISGLTAAAQRSTLGVGNVSTINLTGNASVYLDGTGNFTVPTGVGNVSTLGNGTIWIGNATNVAVERTLSGDATTSNTGVITIANDAVSNAKLANMAAYTVKVRNGNTTGDPSDAAYTDFTTKATPASGDFVVGFDSTGVLKKYDIATLPAGAASPSGTTLSAEILADAPTGYWKCNDASTSLTDSSGNGYHLTTSTGSPTYQHAAFIPSETDKFVRLGSTTTGFTLTTGMGLSYPLTGDYTIEGFLYAEEISGLAIPVFWIGDPALETEVTNIQAYLYQNSGSGLTSFWESGAGTNQLNSSAAYTPVLFTPNHIAVVKDGTANTLTFYRNGVQIGSAVSYATEPTGGTGTIKIGIGYDGNTANTARCCVAHCAFYNGSKLSSARIRAHARAAGLGW